MTKQKPRQLAPDVRPTTSLILVVKPPKHLSAEMTAFWNEVVLSFELEGHHMKLLQSACEAWDRQQMAREAIAEEGITIPTKDGIKVHPAVGIERDSRLAFARILRELDLDFSPGGNAPRPPAIGSNRRGK